MRIVGKKILIKLKAKHSGNIKLCKAIDKLIAELEQMDPREKKIEEVRSDADCVHSDGFYFFDIYVYRAFVLIDINEDGEATVLWAGSHDDYERTFKNNKTTIVKWLRSKAFID